MRMRELGPRVLIVKSAFILTDLPCDCQVCFHFDRVCLHFDRVYLVIVKSAFILTDLPCDCLACLHFDRVYLVIV